MFVSVVAAAAALNSLWQLAILYAIIRWGVDAREEAYLTRKFGAPYTPTKRKPDYTLASAWISMKEQTANILF